MKVELEARYYAVNDEAIREKLCDLSGKQGAQGEIFMSRRMNRKSSRRVVWDIPGADRKFLRIRECYGKTEITLKHIKDPRAIDGTFEYTVGINSKKLDELYTLFRGIGFGVGSYQETERESWRWREWVKEKGPTGFCNRAITHCNLTLDYWPGLKPILEVEVNSGGAEAIEAIETLLQLPKRFDGDIAAIYEQEHGISREDLNKIERLTSRSFPEIPFK